MLKSYESIVLDHRTSISSLEDTVRNLLLIVPGRFGSSEVCVESLNVILNVISLYHDRILGRPKMASHYVQNEPSTAAVNAQNLLSFIQQLEILMDMLASRHCSTQNRWKLILSIEVSKIILRLILLYYNGGAMLLQATPEETASHANDVSHVSKFSSFRTASFRFADVISVYHRPDPYLKLVPESTGVQKSHIVAEIFHIIRPAIYVLGVLRYSCSSWIPFMSSLLSDIISRVLVGRISNWTPRVRQEIHRRLFLYLFYLLRSPFFESFTMLPLTNFLALCGNIPWIGIFFGNCLDLVQSLQSHYFYTSAS
uniref:Peroxisomal membrane protein PEX16 n=1 Tax=Spongospora subterranea TaxID=70186 RepID=A0A0H5RNN7_9EUKA|eukprot:CRZ10339.1 hypothetical protein [Spongospora subterranea]